MYQSFQSRLTGNRKRSQLFAHKFKRNYREFQQGLLDINPWFFLGERLVVGKQAFKEKLFSVLIGFIKYAWKDVDQLLHIYRCQMWECVTGFLTAPARSKKDNKVNLKIVLVYHTSRRNDTPGRQTDYNITYTYHTYIHAISNSRVIVITCVRFTYMIEIAVFQFVFLEFEFILIGVKS